MFSRRNALQSIAVHWSVVAVAVSLVLLQRHFARGVTVAPAWSPVLALVAVAAAVATAVLVTVFAGYAGATGQALPKTQLWDVPTTLVQAGAVSLLAAATGGATSVAWFGLALMTPYFPMVFIKWQCRILAVAARTASSAWPRSCSWPAGPG